MRNIVFAAIAGAAFCIVPAGARAQQPEKTQQPLILQREQLGGFGTADAARARARRGDCAGALDLFDQAIRTLADPTLRRDRGLCHEKLNDPYPAIEDYRAYLSARPDAPDADDIGARLDRIEASVGLSESSGRNAEDPTRRQNTASMTLNASGSAGASGNTEKYDSSKVEESDDTGPLRRGKGFILAVPFIGVRKWFNSDFSQGTWAETVGARLAYSLGTPHELILEIGYEKFNVTQAGQSGVGGFSTQLGYEARLPFNAQNNIDNLVVLGGGLGYDHLFVSASPGNGESGYAFAGIGLRGRGGYRHNMGKKSAVEVTLDGGFAHFFLLSSGASGSGSTSPWLGVNVALLFGL
jgi:hypothetical protein